MKKIFYRKRKYLFDACQCERITNATVKTASRFRRVWKYFIQRARERKIKYFARLCARVSELNTLILGSEKHLRIKRGFNFRARAFIRYSQYGSSVSAIAIDINIVADRNMHLPNENQPTTCKHRLKNVFYSLTCAIDIVACLV